MERQKAAMAGGELGEAGWAQEVVEGLSVPAVRGKLGETQAGPLPTKQEDNGVALSPGLRRRQQVFT